MGLFRKIAAAGMAVLLVLFRLSAVSAAEPEISACAAVLYDPQSGSVLYERSSHEVLPMASTTKIMTALLAFESGRAEEPVEITAEMTAVEGSSMGLKAGDILTLGSIAQGMMMASGNDGANAIALFLGGDADRFSEMMNDRAAGIGMTQTCFVTPSGLDAEGHGSTAYDMALLAAEAMRCPAFAETVGAQSLQVTFLSPEKTVRYENHNRLLQLYADCTGIKTGFTKKAGRCLVSSAERGGASLICVTLNAPDDWNDHIALYEYGFEQMETRVLTDNLAPCAVPVVGGEAESAVCTVREEASVSLYWAAEVVQEIFLPHFVYAPVTAGETIGFVRYTANGTVLAEVPLAVCTDVPAAQDTRSGFQKWAERYFPHLAER
ncbi:MAG: D-alanyl-D-alanine carboxypeptidase family protein [Hominenteromicrobium sp.]